MLERQGWTYASLIKPPALHFCFTQQHVNGMDVMKAHFLQACEDVRSSSSKSRSGGKAKIYGTAAATSDRALVGESLLDYQDVLLSASA